MNVAKALAGIVNAVGKTTFNSEISAFVFGSAALGKDEPNDIDILIVCRDPRDCILARQSLKALMEIHPIDLLLMTEEEELEFDFVRKERCKRLVA